MRQYFTPAYLYPGNGTDAESWILGHSGTDRGRYDWQHLGNESGWVSKPLVGSLTSQNVDIATVSEKSPHEREPVAYFRARQFQHDLGVGKYSGAWRCRPGG